MPLTKSITLPTPSVSKIAGDNNIFPPVVTAEAILSKVASPVSSGSIPNTSEREPPEAALEKTFPIALTTDPPTSTAPEAKPDTFSPTKVAAFLTPPTTPPSRSPVSVFFLPKIKLPTLVRILSLFKKSSKLSYCSSGCSMFHSSSIL